MVFLGVALLLARGRRRWVSSLFSLVATLGLFIVAVPLVAYLFELHTVALVAPIALHTTIGFVVLFVGVITLRPDAGWIKAVAGSRPGTKTVRLLLPLVVGGPVLVAYLFEAGRQAGLYGADFRLALTTVTTVAFLAISVVWSVRRVDQLRDAQLAAAEAARASEARLRTLTEAIPQLVWTCAPDGSCTYLSPQWRQHTGAGEPEQLGYAWLDVVHPDDRVRMMQDWKRSLQTLEVYDTDTRLRGADGEYRWFKQRAVPLIGPYGRVEQWIGTSTDITDIMQARQDLANSEARYRILFEQAAVGIVQLSLDGRILRANPRLCAMLGYGPDELVGLSFRDITHPEDLALDEETLRLLLAGEIASYAREKRYLRKDGTPLWVRVESSIAREGLPCEPYRISVVVDISERRLAEEALFQEKERAEVTLHCIGDAVITTDTKAAVTYLNPVAERLTGWSLDEARGQPLPLVFRIIDEENRKPVPDPVHRCLREGRVTGLPEHTVLVSRFGEEHAIDDSAAPIHDRSGDVLGAVLVFHDVSETRRLSRQLQHDAAHDALTGLVNRREFERRLERAVASARRHGLEHALCYFDLDQFKLVNDTAGHAAGDALLKQVKSLLAGKFRDRDTLARLGGDEFALLLDNCRLDEACRIAEIIVATFRSWRFPWKDRTFHVGASAGVAAIDRGCESAAQALSQADVACYTAKENGRNRVHVYRGDGVKPSSHHARMILAATLNDALNENRFRLFAQPIVPLNGEEGPARNEVLLRLQDGSGAIILPDTFIPAAERYGMMARIDRWVIDNALRVCAATGGARAGAELSLNLSGDSLSSEDLAEFVLQAFRAHGVRPDAICFEVTESAIRNLDNALKFIGEMRRHGCRIALDDFGSGQSSFHYLRTLPTDYLKIDGAFVRNIDEDEQNEAMVAAINDVAHKLGIATIAEYVEDMPTAERLCRIGVDYGQGHAFGRPAPLDRALLAAAA
jgi:diguanylate cyclase (GGDEF)-like protein/PAS domain S-box-containing protein